MKKGRKRREGWNKREKTKEEGKKEKGVRKKRVWIEEERG